MKGVDTGQICSPTLQWFYSVGNTTDEMDNLSHNIKGKEERSCVLGMIILDCIIQPVYLLNLEDSGP